MLPLLDAGTIDVLKAITASSRIGPAPNDPAHTCTIVHTTTADDGGGAPAPGVETRTDVPCLFWAVSGAEVSGDSMAEMGRYRLDLAADTVIDHTDVVAYLGRAYKVVWTPPPYEAGRIVGLELA